MPIRLSGHDSIDGPGIHIDTDKLLEAAERGEVEIVHGARDARIEELEAQLAAIKSEVEKALGLNFSTAKLAVSRVILSYRDWVESAKEMEDIAEKRRERIAELEARAERLKTALEKVEYHQAYTFSCPWCFMPQEVGHASDCARQAALSDNQPTERKTSE